jgi:anti-sigma-K factor RskA
MLRFCFTAQRDRTMVSRLHPDHRLAAGAEEHAAARRRDAAAARPGWRSWLAALAVVAVFALVLHLLYS